MSGLIDNQFVSGGLVLMLTGAVMATLRQLPAQCYGWLRRQFTVSVSITDRDPLFEWTRLWLDSLPYSRRARNVTCSLYWEADEEFSADSKLLFAPAHGNHFFRHGGRLIWAGLY